MTEVGGNEDWLSDVIGKNLPSTAEVVSEWPLRKIDGKGKKGEREKHGTALIRLSQFCGRRIKRFS
jgi:hypothetical protein